jgi:hypothetical protein
VKWLVNASSEGCTERYCMVCSLPAKRYAVVIVVGVLMGPSYRRHVLENRFVMFSRTNAFRIRSTCTCIVWMRTINATLCCKTFLVRFRLRLVLYPGFRHDACSAPRRETCDRDQRGSVSISCGFVDTISFCLSIVGVVVVFSLCSLLPPRLDSIYLCLLKRTSL